MPTNLLINAAKIRDCGALRRMVEGQIVQPLGDGLQVLWRRGHYKDKETARKISNSLAVAAEWQE